jgi:hypothetical protein
VDQDPSHWTSRTIWRRLGTQSRHRWLPWRAGLGPAVPTSRRSAPSRSPPRVALLARAAAGNARTTTNTPSGNAANRARIRCRSRRCTRCRTTELPTVRPTTKPTCGRDSTTSAEATCTTTEPQPIRRPRRTAVAKSARRVSRLAAGSNVRDPRMCQADSSERPLRRRAAMIARPARVRMRNRNPWVLARRRLFGWNVRLPLVTAVVLPVLGARLKIAGSQPSGLRPRNFGRHRKFRSSEAARRSHGHHLPAPQALLRDDLTRSAKANQPWARAHKNAHRWAGDDQSLGGRGQCRQKQRLASPSGRHAVTSVVLAYTGFLWQHPRFVSLWRPT